MSKNTRVETNKFGWTKKQTYIYLGLFWVLVGFAAGLMYDLEWFVQHVVLLNGKLEKEYLGNAFIIDGKNFDLTEIKTLNGFYEILNGANSNLYSVKEIYDTTINWAFGLEGLLFGAAGLIAAFISGPLLIIGINKKKNYRFFLVPTIFLFAILTSTVLPIISSTTMLIVIFTPILGLGYGYRNALDPWASYVSKESRTDLSIVRTLYYAGVGIGSLLVTQLFKKYGFAYETSGFHSGFGYYILSTFLIILGLFLLFVMPKNVFDEKKSNLISDDNLESDISNQFTFKDILRTKSFWISLLIFTLLIGTLMAFNSIWVNTVENISSEYNDPDAVVHIGWLKFMSIPPMIIFGVITQKLIRKYNFKKLLIITAIIATIAWAATGTLVYMIKPNLYVTDIIGAIGIAASSTMSILLGYEYISKITNQKNSGHIFIFFNSIAYGFGAIVFTQINGFFSRVALFGHTGFLVWFIMAIAVSVALLLIILLFKDPSDVEKEMISNKGFEK